MCDWTNYIFIFFNIYTIYIFKHLLFNNFYFFKTIYFYCYFVQCMTEQFFYISNVFNIFLYTLNMLFFIKNIFIFVILYSARQNKTIFFSLSSLLFIFTVTNKYMTFSLSSKPISIWPVNHFVCRGVVESVIEAKRLVLQVSG